MVLEKKSKIGKVYKRTDRQTDGQTDDGRKAIRKAHLSFQPRLAKKTRADEKIKSFFHSIKIKIEVIYKKFNIALQVHIS